MVGFRDLPRPPAWRSSPAAPDHIGPRSIGCPVTSLVTLYRVHELQELVLRRVPTSSEAGARRPGPFLRQASSDKRVIPVQGGEGSAEIVRLQHGALHRIVRQRRKYHTFAARPIPSSLPEWQCGVVPSTAIPGNSGAEAVTFVLMIRFPRVTALQGLPGAMRRGREWV